MACLADVLAHVTNALAIDGGVAVTSFIGAEHLGRQDYEAPCIVYVPGIDAFTPEQMRSGTTKTPRAVRTRMAGMELHLFAEDPTEVDHLRVAELFIDRVVCALVAVCAAGIEFEGGVWMPVDVCQRGRGYVLRCRIALPVVPNPATEGTTTSTLENTNPATDVTGVADFPASDVTGTPAP